LTRNKKKNFLESLSADEVSLVLKALVDDNPDLVGKAYDIAVKMTCAVDADEIRGDVFHALDSLDVDVLYGRSGRTRHGYVQPYDESWVMFEEALAPFIGEMNKSWRRGLPAVAKTYCIGIIKGLWQYEKESISDFTDWVTDAPGEYVGTVVKEWKKTCNPSDE